MFLKGAVSALALVAGVVLTAQPAQAEDDCYVVLRATYQRTPIPGGVTGTTATTLDVNGVATPAVVTITRIATTRLEFAFDFGGGDGFTVEAPMALASPTATWYRVGDVDTISGTGKYDGAYLGDLTFGPEVNGWGTDFITQSQAPDGPVICEWVLQGEFCVKAPPPPPPVWICAQGKPASLTIQYTGEDETASDHHQDAGSVTVEGDPDFATLVYIRVSNSHKPAGRKNTKVFFEGPVALGDTYTADSANAGATRLGGETYIHVFDMSGNLLQFINFHTSCSQPLATGDQFGSALIVDFTVEVKGSKGKKGGKKK